MAAAREILLRLSCFILLLLNAIVQANQENFFEHGSGVDDNSLSAGNDLTGTVDLPEDVTFPYYGIPYSRLYLTWEYSMSMSSDDLVVPDGEVLMADRGSTEKVQTNGVLSFGEAHPEPQSDQRFNLFPYLDYEEGQKVVLIAPFWADVDTTSNRGSVRYRQRHGTTDADISEATTIVRNEFPRFVDFTATWVLVVTWDVVSFHDHDTTAGPDPRNTFQAVLITDSQSSFVFYYYDVIEWTCGTELSGNAITGLTETPIHQAVIGFNAGNGQTAFTKGFEPDVDRQDLPGSSNFGEKGSFAFQVNLEIVAAGCSSTATDFVTYPPYGSILGGERVFMYGPCWFGHIECKFYTRDNVLLQASNGTVDSADSAYCIPDPYFVIGDVEIRVTSQNGGESTGKYRILNLDRISVPEKVSRQDPDGSDWHTAGNDLTITWSQDVYGTNTLLDVHVLNYEEDGTQGPRWLEVYTAGRRVPNTGTFTFRPHGLDNVTSANAFGTIRVQPAVNRGVMLYSDIHPLGYILEEDFQDDPYGWAEDECDAWAEDNDQQDNFVPGLDSCPCTLDQALTDTSRFVADMNCNLFNDNECLLHADAKHCVLSIFPNDDNAGSSCCYEEHGNLMYAGDYAMDVVSVGSMSQKAHISGSPPYGIAGTVPMLSHYKVDMMPFFYCCVMGTNCLKYLHRRPTADCKEYLSPRSAVAFGDPHFITFDNANYTFNGDGDFTLLEYSRSEFKLVGRFNVTLAAYLPGYDAEGDHGATGLTSVIMVEDDADAILVTTSYINGIEIQQAEYHRDTETTSNWEVIDFFGQTWLDFNGVRVSINSIEGYSRVTSVTVMFEGSRIGVNVTRGIYDVSFLAVTPILPPELMNDESVIGLLGNWNNNTRDDLKFRTGGDQLSPGEDDPDEIEDFASSWRSESTTLFPTIYIYDGIYTPIQEPDISDMTTSERQFLVDVCQDNGQCQFDYSVTRDGNLAHDTLDIMAAFNWTRNHTRKVHVCTYIQTPENGTKQYSWTDGRTGAEMDTPNNFFGTEITFKCNEGLTLVGSESRICQENGEYCGSETINECLVTECGTLESVEHGSISIEFSEDGKLNPVAEVTCDEGYGKSKGAARHECVNGEWSGEKALCEESGGSNAGLIAGCVVGAIFLGAISVAGVLIVMKVVKKDDHQPKTAKPVKYSEVEKADLGEFDETGSKKSSSRPTPAPTPAPRSVTSEPSSQQGMTDVV